MFLVIKIGLRLFLIGLDIYHVLLMDVLCSEGLIARHDGNHDMGNTVSLHESDINGGKILTSSTRKLKMLFRRRGM